jgi:hypothetical protein
MNVKAVGAVYEGRLAPTLLPSEVSAFVRLGNVPGIGTLPREPTRAIALGTHRVLILHPSPRRCASARVLKSGSASSRRCELNELTISPPLALTPPFSPALQDRCIVVPHIQGRNDVNMFGVFDGTVDNVAVDFVHARLPALLCGSQPFRDALSLLPPSGAPFAACDVSADITNAMAAAVALGFTHTDEELLSVASTLGAHYSACTGVAAVLAGPYLCVAHVGDSKAVLGGRNGDGAWAGMYMTIDHKPDVPAERSRIEASGGCLTYLHGGKPFLRGGDFAERQAKGDRPMQVSCDDVPVRPPQALTHHTHYRS